MRRGGGGLGDDEVPIGARKQGKVVEQSCKHVFWRRWLV